MNVLDTEPLAVTECVCDPALAAEPLENVCVCAPADVASPSTLCECAPLETTVPDTVCVCEPPAPDVTAVPVNVLVTVPDGVCFPAAAAVPDVVWV